MSAWPFSVAVPKRGAAPRHARPAPDDLKIEASAWWALADAKADALIVGNGVVVSRVLTFLWPTLRKPVFWCDSRRFVLPDRHDSTLILEGADALDADSQRRLLEWLQSGTESTRLIATSSPSLLPLVKDGTFSSELYGRFTAVELVVA